MNTKKTVLGILLFVILWGTNINILFFISKILGRKSYFTGFSMFTIQRYDNSKLT